MTLAWKIVNTKYKEHQMKMCKREGIHTIWSLLHCVYDDDDPQPEKRGKNIQNVSNDWLGTCYGQALLNAE